MCVVRVYGCSKKSCSDFLCCYVHLLHETPIFTITRYIYTLYIHIYMRETHFCSAVLGLRYVGGIKCQPFLKRRNHWKRVLKMIFKGSGSFQFPEAVVTSTTKKAYALPNVVQHKFSFLYRSRKCGVESAE